MKKAIFWMCLITFTLLSVGCPKTNKEPDQPSIEEITTLQDIKEEIYTYDDDPPNPGSTSVSQPPNNTTTPTGTQSVTTTPTKPPTTTTTPTQGDYTVQFMALKDRTRVDEVRRILTASAYFCEVHEVEINGETMYRLRLAGSYSRAYAQQLAEKIKNEIAEIDDYWVTRKN